MLEVSNLNVQLGCFSLSNVNFTLNQGDCVAILGPSGVGKSILLKTLLGIVPIESGSIQINGANIVNLPIEKRGLGYLPQQLGLFPHLSVYENIIYSARAKKIPLSELSPHLDQLIEITEIGSLLKRFPASLSGGERQRVALVRTLAANPRVVLLDEPFTALNASLRQELWWLLMKLRKDKGLSILLVTHDLDEAYFLAENIAVFIDGSQQQFSCKKDLYYQPANKVVAKFIGIKNLFPAEIINENRVSCSILGISYNISKTLLKGKCFLGIRSEHVALRSTNDLPREYETRFAGHFKAIQDLGDTILMQFMTDNGVQFEIQAGSRVVRKYGLLSQGRGVIGIPERDLFLVQS